MSREAGKGSKPRPYSISQKEWDERWNAIFGRERNDYQDILSTEDSILDALDNLDKTTQVKKLPQ